VRLRESVSVPTLAAVFAHPDDETFICGGTLAKYAAEGYRVVLVCATKGEMGRRMGVPPTATRESIPALRQAELTEASAALGIADVQFLGIRDKTLEIQPFDGLVDTVYRHLVREHPEVVVTFHEKFGGHPDHCTIGAATTAAYRRYAVDVPTAQLYFVAWSGMVTRAREYGLQRAQFTAIDVSGHLDAKLRAYRAHRTQSQLMDWVWQDNRQGLRKLGDTEYFLSDAGAARQGVTSLFA
jgi:bacillithiol biosynthesis deacetylase BshB2